MSSLTERIRALEAIVADCGSVVVAFSGGVDSTLLAYMANQQLGHHALIVFAVMDAGVAEDVELARSLASRYGFNFREMPFNELEIEQYAANPADRCYVCKHALLERLSGVARDHGIAVLCDGSNVDDSEDYRPGRRATLEYGVRTPLAEAGFTKADIRSAAKRVGLPNWAKPASPCLSTRIPYGTVIDRRSLTQIDRAERYVRSCGFTNVRVRHHGRLASVEVDLHDVQRLRLLFDDVESRLLELGYDRVVIDEEGFRSGKLNRAITSG